MTDRFKEIKIRYKKNDQGAVTKPASTITSVDRKNGVINFTTSEVLEYSQEIEDIHWLISKIEELQNTLWW